MKKSYPSDLNAGVRKARLRLLIALVPFMAVLAIMFWFVTAKVLVPDQVIDETGEVLLQQDKVGIDTLDPQEFLDLSNTSLDVTPEGRLIVNGELKANGAFVLEAKADPENAVAGEVFFSKETGEIKYFDGNEFLTLDNKQLESRVCFLGADDNCGFLVEEDLPTPVTIPLTVDVNDLTNNGVLLGQGTGAIVATSGPSGGQVLIGNGAGIPTFTTFTGDLAVGQSGAVTISNNVIGAAELAASGVGAGVYGSSTQVPVFTVDDDGRVTAVSNTTISSSVGDIVNGGQLGPVVIGTNDATALSLETNSIARLSIDSAGQLTIGALDCSGNANGGALTANGSGVISCSDDDAAASGSGLTSLNGLTGSTQTFANDTNVTITSAGTTHTVGWAGTLAVARGGTGSTTASGARSNLGAAASGSNTDITSLGGLTTALSVLQGGTGSTTAGGARTNIGAAAAGANSDITSITGLTTDLSVAQGGTGASTFTQNGLVYGNGAGALQATAAGTTGQCLTGNTGGAPTWGTCPGDGVGLASLNGQTGGTQTFATGTAGTDFTISSATNAHTFNIPDAGSGSRGLVTTAAQTIAGIKTFSSNVIVSTNLTVNGSTTLGDSAGDTLLVNGNLTLGNFDCSTNGNGGALTANGSGVVSCSDDDGGDGVGLSSLNGATGATQSFNNDTNVTITTATNTHSLGWTGTLAVGRGGTGASTLATNGVLYGNGAGAVQTETGTAGQVLIASATGVPTFTTLGTDLSVSAAGAATINANAVALGTDTTGNYLAALTGGNGIGVTGSGSEGASPTVALGALTTNWNQTGAFDIILDNAASDLQIRGSGGAFYAQLDAGSLTVDETFTFAPGSGGSLCTTAGNCAGIGGTGDILNDGQNGAVTIGTNNTNALVLETDNTPRITLSSTGALTIAGFDCTGNGNGGALTANGSGVISCSDDDGGDGVGIGSLNGLSGATQTFANGTNVTVSSVGTTHTLGWTGDLAIADGGTGSSTALGARANLGLGGLAVLSSATTSEITNDTILAVDLDNTTAPGAGEDNYVLTYDNATGGFTWVDPSTVGTPQNLFETINTPAGSDPVADGATDTLNFAAGAGVSVTGDASTDTVTIAGTLGADIQDGEVDDDLTVSGSGSVADGALSANVSLLGTAIDLTSEITGTLAVGNGGTGATTAAGARSNLGAAASGANSDITSLSGLTTALSIMQGGTGAATAQAAINNIAGLTTSGDLLYHNGTNTTRLPRGTNNQCLLSTAGSIVWGSCTAGGGGFSSLTLSGDSGADQTITDTNTIEIAGGTNINTVASATDTITVNLEASPTLTGTLTVEGNTVLGNASTDTLVVSSAVANISFSDVSLQGCVLETNASGVLTCGTDGGDGVGLADLNGETGGTQSFATGTTGTDFNISSGSNTHTFNIPDASGTARGLVTTSPQTFAGVKTFSGNVIAEANLTVDGNTVLGNASTDTVVINGTSVTLADFDCSGDANGGTLTANGSGVISCTDDDGGDGVGIAALSLDADSGTAEALADSDTIIIAGGTNINTTVSATDTITVNLENAPSISGLLTLSAAGTALSVTNNITLGGTLTVGSTVFSEADLDALDDGTIALGAETTGTYDSTPDTIGDDGTIVTGEISDGTIAEVDLNVTNGGAGVDGYFLSYNNGTGDFTWVADGSGGVSDTDTFAALLIDGAAQSSGALTLDFDGTDFLVSEAPADTFDITVRDERIEDIIGTALTAGTQTDITVTYDDASDNFDFVVDTLPNLSGTLDVDSGGTGVATFTTDGILYGNGAGAVQVTAAGTTNQCLLGNTGGAPTWGSCTAGGGGFTNLTLAGDTGTSQTISDTNTITVAGGTNIATVAGATDTITINFDGTLPIGSGGTGATTDSGARSNLGAAASGANGDITSLTALTAITPGAALTVGAAGQSLTLQGSAATTLTATDSGFTTTVGFGTPTANVAINFPVAAAGTYDVCTTSGNCLGGGGGGANTTLSNLSSVAINTSLLPATTNSIDLGSDTAAFRDLYLVNAAVFEGSIADGNETTIAVENPTVDVTYRFANPSGTGTFDVCTTDNNCVGGAGGGAPNAGAYLTVGNDATLTSERAIVAGTNLTATDGGANSNYTINVVNNPTFSTSITSPILDNAGTLAIGGTNQTALTLGRVGATTTISGSSLILGTSNVVRTAAGTTTFDFVDGADTTLSVANSGAGDANLSVGGDITLTGNFTIGSTVLSEADLDALDDGTIALGTETTGTYDSTPDTIGDDGTIVTGEISDGTIAEVDLNVTNGGAGVDGYFLSYNNGTGDFTWVADGSGGVTDTNTFAALEVDGAAQSTGAITLDFDSTDFLIAETPTDSFDIQLAANVTQLGSTIDLTSEITGTLAVGDGGTGATSATVARSNLGAAASGANSDITSIAGLTTDLSVAQGGTGASTLTLNGVLYGNGTGAIQATGVGTTNQCLLGNTGAAPSWGSCTAGGGAFTGLTLSGDTGTDQAITDTNTIEIAGGTNIATVASATDKITINFDGTLPVASGGTGSTLLTAGGILLGNGTGAIANSGILANGEILIGDGAGAPVAATLTDGAGISITNGTGSITVASTLGVSVDLTSEITGTLAVGNGGTGATSALGAINSLSGLTTQGDILYHDGTDSTRLARGTTDQCLVSTATTIQWQSCFGSGSSSTLQAAYNAGNGIIATTGRDIDITLNDLAVDPNFDIVIGASSGSAFRIYDDATLAVSYTTANGLSVPGGGVESQQFGYGASAGGQNSLAVGQNSNAGGISSTVLGRSASSSANSVVVVGQGASATAQESIAIGSAASTTDQNATAIGAIAVADFNSVALGHVSSANSNWSTALGASTDANFNASIAVGFEATTTAANQLVVGSNDANITQGYFGSGVTDAAPADFTLNATGGSGTDIAGADFTLAAGRGTGAGAGGAIILQTASLSGTSAVLNPLTTRLTVTEAGDTVLAADQSLILTGGVNANIPGTPTEGEIFYDSENNNLLIYDGTQWEQLNGNSSATYVVAASDSAHPELADYRANGTSDEDTINTALAALPATGGSVYLMEGTYVIDGEISSFSAGDSLFGAGAGSIIQLADSIATDTNMIHLVSDDNVTLRDFALDGNASNQLDTNALHGVRTSGGTDAFLIDGLTIYDTEDHALSLTGVYGRVTNNFILNTSDGDGININGASHTVSGNVIDDTGLAGSEGIFNSASDTTISGNSISGFATGISNSGAYVTVSDNTVEGAIAGGIGVTMGAATVTGNVVRNAGAVGILATGEPKVINDNIVTGSTGHGIRIWTADNSVVSGNSVYDSGSTSSSSGIRVDSDYTQVTSNQIEDTAGTGNSISITGTGNYIADNFYSGTGAESISDTGTNTTFANQLTQQDVLRSDSSEFVSSRSSTLTGTVDVTISTDTVAANGGTGTAFDTELEVGDRITVNGETHTIESIASATSLTTTTTWAATATDQAATRQAAPLAVRDSAGNTDFFVSESGDIYLPNLASCDTLDTDLDGLLSCGTDAGAAGASLQAAYDVGNTISTAGYAAGRNIAFTLANETTDSDFNITVASGSTSAFQIFNDATLAVVYTAGNGFSVPGATNSEQLGAGAAATGTSAVALGSSATASGNDSVAIGRLADSALNGTAVGAVADALSSGSIAVGRGANVGASHTSSIALGLDATTTAANQLVIGSQTSGAAILDYYFGAGTTNSVANVQDITFNASGGLGTDIGGADFTLAAGRGTGTGVGGSLIFQTALQGGSSTVLNSLTTQLSIDETGLATFTDDVIVNGGQLSVYDGAANTFTIQAEGAIGGNYTLSVPTEIAGPDFFCLEVAGNCSSAGNEFTAVVGSSVNSTNVAAAGYIADGDGGGAGNGDQVEINAAITAANAAGGGKVLLLEGTYTIDDTILLLSDVEIIGSGIGATNITIASGLNPTSLDFFSETTNPNNFAIRDLSINVFSAFNTGTLTAINLSGTGGFNERSGIISGVEVSYFGDSTDRAISLASTYNLVIEDSIFHNGEIAIDYTTGAADQQTIIRGNAFTSIDEIGIQLAVSGVSITGNTFDEGIETSGDEAGIHLNGAGRVNITGNTFNEGNHSGIIGSGFNASITIGDNLFADLVSDAITGDFGGAVIDGNTITNITGHGIELLSTADVVVSGNSIYNVSLTGITLSFTNDVVITGNDIGSSGDEGILVSGSALNTIAGNHVEDSGDDGIALAGNNNSVTGNYISGSGTDVAGSHGISVESAADDNNIIGNTIYDTVGTGSAIDIASSFSANTYLADNVYTGTGATAITDASSDTIYANQLDSSGNLDLQAGASGTVDILSQTNVVQGALTVGAATTTAGTLTLYDGSTAFGIGINVATQTLGAATVSIPDLAGVSDTFCLLTLDNCSGTAATLQSSYANDADGSDAIIALTTGDDSLVVRNPASGGTDSLFVQQFENLETGNTDSNFAVLDVNAAGSFDTTAGNLTNYGLDINSSATESAGANVLTNVGLNVNVAGADTNYAALFNGGNVGIGTTSADTLLTVAHSGAVPTGGYDADTLAVFRKLSGSSANITIQANSSDSSRIFFGDQTNEDQGEIRFNHGSNALSFHVQEAFDPGLRIIGDGTNSTAIFGEGSITPNAAADLVVAVNNSALPTLSDGPQVLFVNTASGASDFHFDILAGNTAEAVINFGDTDDENPGYISYDNNTDALSFGANAATPFTIDSNGTSIFGGRTIGTATNVDLLVAGGNSGGYPALDASTRVLFAKNGSSADNLYSSLIAGDTGEAGIYFGDVDDENPGYVVYDNNTNALSFGTNAANALTISSTQVATFAGDLTVSGDSTFNNGVDFNFTDTDDFIISSTITGTNGNSVGEILLTNNTTSGTQNGLRVENVGGSGASEALISIVNSDVDPSEVVADGIRVTSAAGGITDGIDVSDGDIVNAISVGSNTILGSAATIDFNNFDVSGGGAITAAGLATLNGGLTLDAVSTSTGDDIYFSDASFATCTALETVAGILTCGVDDGSGGASLQAAYGGGNTITTTTGSDIDITLADTATDSNFTIDIAASSTSNFQIQNAGTAAIIYDTTNGLSVPGAGTSSLQIGHLAVAGGNSGVALGVSATSAGLSGISVGNLAEAAEADVISIGQNAGSDFRGGASAAGTISIGAYAGPSTTGVNNAVLVGLNAETAGDQGVSIGFTTRSTTDSIAIGAAADALSGQSIAVGTLTEVAAGHTSSIALGYNATTTAANQLVIGSTASNAYITDYYFGSGVSSGTAHLDDITFNSTGGTGTDVSAGDFAIAAGRGTGTGFGGAIKLQTAAAGVTGTTLNPVTTRLEIQQDGDLYVSGSTAITGSAAQVITGSIDPTASTTVVGVGTFFTEDLLVGDKITVSGETRTVVAISSDFGLTVDTAFTDNGNDTSVDRLPSLFVIEDSSQNSKLFVNDDGSLIVDGTTFAVDAVNNRVGIGNSAPTVEFDVTGAGAFSSAVTVGGALNLNAASSLVLDSNAGSHSTITDNTTQLSIAHSTSGGAINVSADNFNVRASGGGVNHISVQSNGTVSLTPTTDSTASFTVYDQDNNAIVFVDTTNDELEVVGDIRTSGSLIVADGEGVSFGTGSDATLAYDGTADRVELTSGSNNANLFIDDRLGFGAQTITITDDGVATDSLTPGATYVRVDIDETADGSVPDLAISEATATDGDLLIIVNNETDATEDTFTITNSAAVVNLPGATTLTLGPNDSVTLLYIVDRWVTIASSDN